MGIVGSLAKKAFTSTAGATAAAAVVPEAAAKDVPVLLRMWRTIPERHRPYAAYAGLGGVASAGAFAAAADDPKVQTARFYGGLAPIAAAGMGALLIGTSRGPFLARLRPATSMVKWTAPIAVPAYLLHGAGDPAPAKPGAKR